MRSDIYLRPEDFRYAWVNAYRESLLQIAELQQNSDSQLRVSREMLERMIEQADYVRASFHEASVRIVDQMNHAHSKNEAAITAATQRLTRQSDSLFAAQKRYQTDTKNAELELARARSKFEALRMKYRSRSLFVRLWLAFRNQD